MTSHGGAQKASFSPYAWAVGQWLHALSTCSAQQMEQFVVLRALLPLARQAHAALRQRDGLREAQTWVSRIETELVCPLHHGLMRQPGALACGHVFEATWLAHLAPPNDHGAICCPTCRETAPVVEAPAALRRILQALRAFYEQTGHPIEAVEAPPELVDGSESDGDEALAQLLTREELEGIVYSNEDEMAPAGFLPPLFQAAMSGSGEFVESILLLEEDIDLNAPGAGARTVLHLAADNNHLEVARVLLHAGADPNVQDETDFTPLHLAAARGWLPMLALLIEHGADVNASTPPPLCEAVSMGQVEAARLLLEARAMIAMPDTMDTGLLHEAVASQEPEMVRLLLDAGCELRGQPGGATPLECAVDDNLNSMVDILLEAYAHLDSSARADFARPLAYAAQRGSLDLVNKLIAAGADIHAVLPESGAGPLHLAIADGAELEVIEALAQAGAKLDQPDGQGRTPYDLAMAQTRADVLAYLQTRTATPRD